MGSSAWSATDYTTLHATSARASAARSHHEVFTSSSLHADLDPKKFGPLGRECRKSAANPNPTPIMLALDVTGSMGSIAHSIAKTGLSALITSIFDRKPVSDPQIAFLGVGDVDWDRVPLQMSQFEADSTMIAQLEKLYVEGAGGGNHSESYTLPWYAAHFKVSADAFSDGRKGFLFTFGDELPPPALTSGQLTKVFGPGQYPEVLPATQLLEALQENWHVFHLMIEEGSYFRRAGTEVRKAWTELMGQNAIPVSDHTKLGEIIVSLMQVTAGDSADKVAATWSGSTAVAVAHSIGGYALAKQDSAVEMFD